MMLKLISSDFNSLTEPCGYTGTGQFQENTDCPIARALIRNGYEDVYVGSHSATAKMVDIKVDLPLTIQQVAYYNVERCRQELLEGKAESIL